MGELVSFRMIAAMTEVVVLVDEGTGIEIMVDVIVTVEDAETIAGAEEVRLMGTVVQAETTIAEGMMTAVNHEGMTRRARRNHGKIIVNALGVSRRDLLLDLPHDLEASNKKEYD